MEEIWKDIAGYEGCYQVSNKGRMKSLLRVVKHLTGGKLTVSEKILTLKDRNGYDHISLWKENIEKRFKVHRLVAQAFIPNPENKPQVNHIDGDRKNNHVSNLEWVTGKENAQHAIKTGLTVSPRGVDVPISKLKDADVIEMRKLRHNGLEYPVIAKMFGVAVRATRAACIGVTWRHVDYPFCPNVNKKRR